jgi:micrococcal nuclease
VSEQRCVWLARLAFVIAALALRSQGAEFRVNVIGIVDGDTIEVLHNGRPERVRLVGIDSPERNQAFGSRARQFTGKQVFRQIVTVRSAGSDPYGRTLGEVILPDGRSLNRELVANGLAWHYRRFSADRELARLEEEARAARRGLWSDPHAIPPWEFRRRGKGALAPNYGSRGARFLGVR